MKTKTTLQMTVLMAGLVGIFFTVNSHAQTILSGNISGTWTPSGNPYIISANATVQAGQTLTIQPGVIVWIGDGVSITVNGTIQAVGAPSQHISFQSPVSYEYWNTLTVNNTGPNIFNYCDFSDVTNALIINSPSTNQLSYCTYQNVGTAITLMAIDSTLNASIVNCSFSNCWGQAVYGVGYGEWGAIGTVMASIGNCFFGSASGGCIFDIYVGNGNGQGHGNVSIQNNVFNNITNSAISFVQGSTYNVSGLATVLNNVVLNAGTGMACQDPWNATVESCVFENCGNAVVDSGSLSRTVSYNDFFGNANNFTGYSSAVYGTIILANRNGTPCDLLYNIYQNPQFVSATNFQLQPTSPLIDAGEGSPANFDSCFPPSLGTVTNDIGAYGGPNACQWIYSTPSSSLSVAIAPYIGVTINPPSAGHYELEYASKLTGTNNWIQLTNMDLSEPFTFIQPASSPAQFYRAVKLY